MHDSLHVVADDFVADHVSVQHRIVESIACGIARSAGPAGRSRKSATACGAWAAGPGRTTTSRCARWARVALGCNFFDTAWAYGEGKSERLLGRGAATVHPHAAIRHRRHQDSAEEHEVAGARRRTRSQDTYPADHIREYTEKSLRNLGVDTIDLQQFHVWSDAWADDEGWQRAVDELKREKLVRAFGISVNRWQPANVLRALKTGLIDSVQVVYNIFDQAPEDELFPYCEAHDIAVIARVPFDEGSLTGTLTAGLDLAGRRLAQHLFQPREPRRRRSTRVDRLQPLVPEGMDLPELALRFILEHPAVSTTIPGMRRPQHVERNLAASDGARLPPRLREALRAHRWDRRLNATRSV